MKWDKRIRTALWAMGLGVLLLGCSWWGRRQHTGGPVPRQGKIEQPLVDAMDKARADKRFSIIVAMSKQVTEAEKRALFQSITESNQIQIIEAQRTNLINALVNVARVNQAPLVGYLRGLESNGVVREVRPMWIANMIGVQAPKGVITALATSNEVEFLHLDLPRRLVQATGQLPPSFGSIGMDPPVALSQVNQTVIVAVLDTGVDYTHPDLTNHIWMNSKEDKGPKGFDSSDNDGVDDDLNGYKDDVIGWNFIRKTVGSIGTNDPKDLHGHGTHVAGVIVGDGTGGTRTGIAPQAQIMILKESNSFRNDSATEQECFLGVEYAVSNKAHIINFSAGWPSQRSPAYELWRNTVQNVTDAGILFVTVAGNTEGSAPVPDSVITPGRVSSAMTVGATASDDSVTTWSCSGPITWEGFGSWNDYPYAPGLMKPDLVAPGENVLTTHPGGSYRTTEGTSMAAPYVSGVAALLRAKDPALNPYAVRYILEETATDVLPSGPDAASGWGLLNAARALTKGIDSTPYDLSVDHLRTDPLPQANQPTLFFATVTNLGGQVVGNAELQFYFADAASRTVNQLNPVVNGKPNPTLFKYIGSYFVPVVGPKGTHHGRLEGVVRWTIPGPRQNHWWLGVRVLRGATSVPETNEANNQALVKLDP